MIKLFGVIVRPLTNKKTTRLYRYEDIRNIVCRHLFQRAFAWRVMRSWRLEQIPVLLCLSAVVPQRVIAPLPMNAATEAQLASNIPLLTEKRGVPGLSVIREGETVWLGNFGVQSETTESRPTVASAPLQNFVAKYCPSPKKSCRSFLIDAGQNPT
jgi:hypothetical protein